MSLAAIVMVWPLTVKVPAVTGTAKPALLRARPETSLVGLKEALAVDPTCTHCWPDVDIEGE